MLNCVKDRITKWSIDLAEKYAQVYSELCRRNALPFILFFFKINLLHILFEVLITVSYLTLVVCYSSKYAPQQIIPLSSFFSKILSSCILAYSAITILYIVSIILSCMYYVGKIDQLEPKDSFTTAIKRGINLGLILYIVAGILTAKWPGYFAGIDAQSLNNDQHINLAFSIIQFGVSWFILSTLRFKRINWDDAIRYSLPNTHATKCSRTCEKPCTRIINKKTLSYTFASVSCQTLITFAILRRFLKAFSSIPQDDFNYYNLLLAVFFALFSAYFMTIIKHEYMGSPPGFSIRTTE